MSNPNTDKLLKKRQQLLASILELQDALHGSIVERYTTCQRPNCRCHKGEKHGPRFYLSVNESGHQRQKYIRTADLPKARQGVANYHKIQELLDQVTRLNLEILRND